MFDQALLVKYITLKSCFIYLPSNIKKSTVGSCIKLTYDKNKTAYFSVGASNTTLVDENYVAINSLYAKSLGILENDLVNVCEINALPIVKSLTITPLTNEDYEVLEMLADNVQSTLLEQIRVVYSNQRMIIWIGSNINVTVFIGDVKPVSLGVLEFLTEVVIKTPDDSFKKVSEGDCIMKKFNEIGTNYSSNFQELFTGTKLYKNQYKNCTRTPKTSYSLPGEIFRMVDTELWPNLKKFHEVFNAFTYKKFAKQTWQCTNSLDTPIFCSVKLLSSIWDREVFVRLYFIEDILDSNIDVHYNLIFVDSKVLKYFDCEIGTRVILRDVTETPIVKEIQIHTKKVNIVNVKEIVQYLLKHKTSPFIINSNFVLNMPGDINFSLKYLPDNPKYCIFDTDFIKRCTFSLYEDMQMISEEIKVVEEAPVFKDICNFQTVINDVKAKFLHSQLENIIITGRPGIGKTTLLQTINAVLRNYPYLIYTEIIQCKQLKGKTLDSLQKVLNTTFSKLLRSQPSALLLDDVHVLCETAKGEENANTVHINRVSEMVYNLLKMLSDINDVAIIFTSEDISALNENIYVARGDHLFKNVYTIEDLNKHDTQSLLRYLFDKHVYNDEINFEDLSLKMDGFVIQDIINFYNKALFEAYKEEGISDENLVIQEEHCLRALENTTVLSLENVQLYSPGDKTLSDVGGLSKVKNTLIESLLWPAQYPSIFANAPLRLQSGILLYGPPGTGKTLLAGAAAKHCNLRLIAVKGPELLSKYIGASEQGVRNIFEKAKSARPCILFFDEFDSMAPRRGHNNTGVTDRVVNQLLTQLDGVESLVGVCVLAATSRPDLLDPALLRPGRLDKQLFCPLPDQPDRLEILRTCSKDFDLAPDTNLEHIAMLTTNYSGADLQAILSTARLSSVELLLKKGNINEAKKIEITQQLLLQSLKTTRPSLTKSERQKYELIYLKFQGKITGDFKVGTRATFA